MKDIYLQTCFDGFIFLITIQNDIYFMGKTHFNNFYFHRGQKTFIPSIRKVVVDWVKKVAEMYKLRSDKRL